MSKRELIDAIRLHNRTVSPEFLSRFGEHDLEAYLGRVSEVAPVKAQSKIGVTQLAKDPGRIVAQLARDPSRIVTLLARQPLVMG